MTRLTVQPGDIVVIVPRWLIIAVGLVMLMMGLSVSFFLLFAGRVEEGIFLSLLVLVTVPFQLLIIYIVWRYYWYFMVMGVLVGTLTACTVFTGAIRIGGNSTGVLMRLASGGPAMPVGNALAVIALVSFGLALAVSILIGYVINTVLHISTPVAPARKSRPRDEQPPGGFPPPDDPYWDDSRQKRRRDLWKDER